MSAARVRDFRDLIVWQRSMALARHVYALSGQLPAYERGRLADQMRRAVSSVGANIAEGHSKPHRREYLRYLNIAYGSAKELQHHLLMAEAVGILPKAEVSEALTLATEVCRMLWTMRQRLAEPPR